MNPEEVTIENIRAVVEKSGYPFELEVASHLLDLQWDVRASYQVFSPIREREIEVDIVALKHFEFSNDKRTVKAALRLMIECKDNAYPYVLFGLPAPPPPPKGIFDGDYRYAHVDSTIDQKHPNHMSLVLFDSRIANTVRSQHHHFSAGERFHISAAVEPHNKELKLNVSDRLRTSVAALGEALYIQHRSWISALETVKHVPGNETFLSITFPMLVHSGRHFRVIGRSGEPVEATHTPLFTSRETSDGSTPYVVDFVAFNSLDNALAVIKTSFDAMVGHLGKYFTE